ncbi:MAG TPA: bifunctional metallophosphatase/5'-nucleotidase [Thermoanaerobaculia bacterium]|nr:bifunctional metallophosphatase/5'-nucleotidase [Thermoanaerobaculia bacterium]
MVQRRPGTNPTVSSGLGPGRAGRSRRRPWLGLLLVSAALAGCTPPRTLELTLLHTTDGHARFLEIDARGTTCKPEDAAVGRCFGGAARRATAVAQVRAEVPEALLLDAGDQFQGTLFYNRFRGEPIAAVMNQLGYDAMVVGNHEFDDGPPVLAEFARSILFPLLATNVDSSNEPQLSALLQQSAVLEVQGHRIGVVGVITEETPSLASPGENLRFLPIEESLRNAVERFEADGIDVVIALSHAGFQRDREIAAAVAGVDVIIGGHTNTLLSNSADGAEGPYPLVVESPRGEPVLVVTAYAYGKYLGRLDVVFDRGVASAWRGEPILLDATIEPDSQVTALLEPYAVALEGYANEVIGVAAERLEGETSACRFRECAMGNLIADALLEHGAQHGVEVALQNGGGIRSSIAEGPITVGEVLEVLPFGNAMSTFGLRGADLLEVLEHGVSQADDPANGSTGRFLQVAGLHYSFTLGRPVGQRILSAAVTTPRGGFAPVDTERTYRVVINDFNRTGGDGFDVLRDRAIDPYDDGPILADLVIAYLSRHSPVSPRLEGRVRELPAP